MNPVDRQKTYEQQTTSLYAGLGEFVARFELVVFAMRQNLIQLWSGGSVPAQALVQSAVAELTADPIAKIFLASHATAIRQSALEESEKAAGEKILADICKQVRAMITTRNEVVHGTWFIGWAAETDTDFSVADGHKPVNTKAGVEHRDISRNREQFDELIDECRRLVDLVNRVGHVVLSGRSFSKNFITVDKKVTLEPQFWTFKKKGD